jgi:hypothetical protein
MNPLSLFRNIAGTLRSVSVEDTALIYAVPLEVIEFVNENKDLLAETIYMTEEDNPDIPLDILPMQTKYSS